MFVAVSGPKTRKTKEIHHENSRRNLLENDLIVVGNAVIDMYAKCNLPAKAKEVPWKLPARNTSS